MSVHVFAGPTIPAARVSELLPSACLHPPVRHGDLLRQQLAPGETVLIIDGLWHQSAPVRHKEILMLLAEGIAVVGAASMGALRAAELEPFGMLGIGAVFRAYRDGVLDADDEVAVVQGPDGQALSHALVNLRTALHRAAGAGRVTTAEAHALADLARALPYPRRSWNALARAADGAGLREAYGRANAWRLAHPWDQKREDAEEALRTLALRTPGSADTSGWCHEPWRTSFVRYWEAAHRTTPGTGAPFLAHLTHQQLYDLEFGARWHRRVLARIAETSTTRESSGTAEAALGAAAEAGLIPNALSPVQLAHWLTEHERHTLDEREMLMRVMVRSARLDGAWTIWPTSLRDAGDLINPELPTATAVEEAFRLNAATEAANPLHSTAHLAPDRIAAHLLDRWHLARDADRPVRDAAARDRAFRDFAGAVEAARTFYLGAVANSSAGKAGGGASVSVRT
ncbi:TfuA-like protein [Streptomyces sp. NBC_01716]|uniref:TfuA-like protein n=1 Tax=Streptomyces sp. NBC_01716 TaxID=2975917 RepID=UPI002E336277|nr:TfuA-like protein [Streptomyces sp. NBC_01716]